MARKSAEVASQTRAAIIDRAVDVASTDGLEGVTIGRLAEDLGMSKSGVIGHFGSKEALQLAAIEVAADMFRREVWERAVTSSGPGLPRLQAVVDVWVDYLTRDIFPGGCFLTAASCEFDSRPGPVREAVAGYLRLWRDTLEAEVRTAVAAGDLPEDTDPAQVAFELNAAIMGANQELQLFNEPAAVGRARRVMRRSLQRG